MGGLKVPVNWEEYLLQHQLRYLSLLQSSIWCSDRIPRHGRVNQNLGCSHYGFIVNLIHVKLGINFRYEEPLVLGIVANLEVKMVLRSAQILEYVEVHMMPLNWRKERNHGRLGATLALLWKTFRRH